MFETNLLKPSSHYLHKGIEKPLKVDILVQFSV